VTFGRSRRFRLMAIWSGTGKEPWEHDMTRATTQASITSQTITVEHIRISSELSFAEVRRKFEGTVPKLDTGIAEALRSGDARKSTKTTGQGCRASRSAIMALCCRFGAGDATRCSMKLAIP
jgi:hypothetical protein